MEWFLLFGLVTLFYQCTSADSVYELVRGEKIIVVNVNDTADLHVEEVTIDGVIKICKAKLYNMNRQLNEEYSLIENGNWNMADTTNNENIKNYFELLDYYKSCSFAISPFQEKFYGYWVVNTTYEIEDKIYGIKIQQFFISAPTQRRSKYADDVYLISKDETEKINNKRLTSVINNAISLRPKRVSGQIKKCQVIHHDEIFHLNDQFEILQNYNHEEKLYEIYPNTDDEFYFTGNENSCQFKILEMKFIKLPGERYRTFFGRWEIITHYVNETDKSIENTINTRETFEIYNTWETDDSKRQVNITRGTYINFKITSYSNISCQFETFDGRLKKEIMVYNKNEPTQSDSFIQLEFNKVPENLFNVKYLGSYHCIDEKEQMFPQYLSNFRQSFYMKTSLCDYPKKIITEYSMIYYLDILSTEGSVLTALYTSFNYPKYCRIQKPNGTFIKNLKFFGFKKHYAYTTFKSKLSENLTINDNGVWKFRCSSLSDNIFYIISISTWDSTRAKIIVDMTETNFRVTLYSVKKNPEKCFFMSANGEFSKTIEPITHNYKPIINFEFENISSLIECEFIIDKSSELNEYGAKQVAIDYGNFKINRTIILQKNVEKIEKYNELPKKLGTNDYVVKYDDAFWVNCSHNKPLIFCRIQKANEDVIQLTDSEDLAAGNCSMFIKNANILDHHGDWRCYLAFNESNIGSTTMEYYFSVEVRNYYVKSGIENIYENGAHSLQHIRNDENENYKIKKVIFRCEISNFIRKYKNDLIGADEIDYCLWKHPNGYIIPNTSERYTINTTTLFSCDLTMHKIYENDFGNWRCDFHLKLATNLSSGDTIEFIQRPDMVVLKNYTITPMLKRNITVNDERHHIGSTGPGLDCQISPPLEAHMFDCKWTKINGNNNNFTADDPDGGHWVPRKNNSVCELRFLEWIEYGDQSDYGKWRCCVNIVNSVDETICQDIELPNEVYHPPKKDIGIYIFISIVIICVLIVVCPCFYLIIKRLKEKLEKQRQSQRLKSKSQQSRVRRESQRGGTRSASHPRQLVSTTQRLVSPENSLDRQSTLRITRVRAEPNIYV